MSDPLQHYVPKFMLRRFSSGKKDLVHAYDKHSDKTFAFSTSKKSKVGVAAERAIYDFEFLGVPMTLELSLSNLEAKAAEATARIIQSQRIDPEWHLEKATLASFLAVQLVRTRATMATLDDLSERMEGYFRSQGAPEEFFEPEPEVGEKANARKAHYARMITNAPRDLAPLLVDKVWLLLQTVESDPFLMGDHPFARFNEPGAGVRGKLGLRSEGVQIYFPLSPTLALCLMCRTYLETMIDGVERIDRLLAAKTGNAEELRDLRSETMPLVEAILTGGVVKCRPENVEHFNSLQILEAERYVFSCKSDFQMTKEMIAANEATRHGPRFVEGSGAS
jgi:hypothetical protein